jgi:hypothetical protein
MAIRNTYDRGDKIKVTATFTNLSGAYIDPGAVYLQYVTPAGVANSLVYPTTVSRTSSGIYYADISIAEAGDYWYRVHASGVGQSAAEGGFIVKRSHF